MYSLFIFFVFSLYYCVFSDLQSSFKFLQYMGRITLNHTSASLKIVIISNYTRIMSFIIECHDEPATDRFQAVVTTK